jgi:hypothetical protein
MRGEARLGGRLGHGQRPPTELLGLARVPARERVRAESDQGEGDVVGKADLPRELEGAPVGVLRGTRFVSPLSDPGLQQHRGNHKDVVPDGLGVPEDLGRHGRDGGNFSRVDGTLGPDQAARRDAPMVTGCAVVGARLLRSGHRGAAPLAAVELGLLYERRWRRGDAVRARALFQLAIDSGHEKAAPLAELHLRGLNRRTRRGMPRAPRQATASQTKRAQH